MKPAADVLKDLARRSNVSIHSNSALVGGVEDAAAEDDAERKEKELDALRRKPSLQPVPASESGASISLAPWEVLHALARAISLSNRGAGRGLAEHWGALKYTQALTGDPHSFMKLSPEGRDTADYYKALQSSELGVGFAVAATERILRHRYPDHAVSIVPADTALRAGWALTSRDKGPRSGYRYRPHFFAEVWKPGEPSRVFPIAAKGNHSNAAVSHTQLASASAHVEAVHIGAWDQTPSLIHSTELPLDGPLTLHVLQTKGTGGWLRGSGPSRQNLDESLEEENHFPGIQPPVDGDEPRDKEPGFHVTSDRYEWFRHSLARTAAGGVTAFTGDGEATIPYLTTRQGRKRFTGIAHPATGSVHDASYTLLGTRFVGTDHVFRLNRTRVEAFSGVAADLFELLAGQQVEQYRSEIHSRRSSWPKETWDRRWKGPVSIHPDGTVLAIRLLIS
ncbi:hypothetical protein [Streptomyces celluloflavus]|uniref:hypothetical protein n=1 Tax=Streptomyces celluloflavus TaxID=58344 RepID=UPI00345F1E3D|nr:hypothetical protein OG717_20510 [Streptomyces celluloflavus]